MVRKGDPMKNKLLTALTGSIMILIFSASSVHAQAPIGSILPQSSSTGVTSWNTRTGAVVPVLGDYTIPQSSPVGSPTYAILAGDIGKQLTNANAFALQLPACASVGNGWFVYLRITGTPIILVTSSETIDGLTATIYSGNMAASGGINTTILFETDGANWFTSLSKVFVMTAATASVSGTGGVTPTPSAGFQDLPLNGAASYATSTAARFAGQTAAKTVLTMTTTVSSDASYLLSANLNLTAVTTASFIVTATYTDESNVSRVLTLPFVQLAGVPLVTITNITGTGPYEGLPVHIRCKANTTIVVATVGTFTSVTYNVESHVRHIL